MYTRLLSGKDFYLDHVTVSGDYKASWWERVSSRGFGRRGKIWSRGGQDEGVSLSDTG